MVNITLPSQPPPLSFPPQVQECGRRQCWRTLLSFRGSGLRWPSCQRSDVRATCQPSCCHGCPVGQPRTQVGTVLSAAASEDAARLPHCQVQQPAHLTPQHQVHFLARHLRPLRLNPLNRHATHPTPLRPQQSQEMVPHGVMLVAWQQATKTKLSQIFLHANTHTLTHRHIVACKHTPLTQVHKA